MSHAILEAARDAYAAGLSVIPVRTDGSKAPAVAWRPYASAPPTVDEMRGWGFAGQDGLGVVGGVSRLDPWDFDCAETFQAFVDAANACGLGPVVAGIRTGYEDQTPSGGRRWLVRRPAGVPFVDTTCARRPGRAGEPPVKVLIELTTFSIVAPSGGRVHPSGRSYVRVFGGFDTIAEYTAEQRAALLELARSFDQMPRREPLVRAPARPASGEQKPGDDYNQRTTWPAVLEPLGWTRVREVDGVTHWRRPGKREGVSATTNHAGSDLFYPFSSSTEFEADRSYTKFGVYALLAHGGDFRSAATALAADGYGTPREGPRPRLAPRSETVAAQEARQGVAPVARCLADIPAERVTWLWPSRLAVGSLCLWVGDGGLGKSRAAYDLLARLTRGADWPDAGTAPHTPVVVLTAEDSPSAVVRPALEAAGADLRQVHVLEAVRTKDGKEKMFSLDGDLQALEQLLDATGARVVLIDPVSAYFGTRLDSYRDTDVRTLLAPLAQLAERRGLAVLGIMHVGKTSDRQARHRVLGSVAFVNAARLVFGVGPDPDGSDRRLLVPIKANIVREAAALAFTLVDAPAHGSARVVWDAQVASTATVDEVLNGRRALAADPDDVDADEVLRQLMDDETWPIDASVALAAAKAHGIADRTMRRAARRAGVRVEKVGYRSGRWQWHLPGEGDTGVRPLPITEGDTCPLQSETAENANVLRRGHEGDTSRHVSPSVSPSGRPEGDTDRNVSPSAPSQNIGVFDEEDTLSRRGHQVSSRAREGEPLPAWVSEVEAPPPAGSSDAVLGRDEEDDDVFVV